MTGNAKDPLNLIICGVGGQGNILISGLLAGALIQKGHYVTVGETFGAAQRGGAVFSSVRISSRQSYGPLIPEGKGDIVLGLEPLETLRMLHKYGNPDVSCVTNSYPVFPVGVLSNKQEYPGYAELEQGIRDLSRNSWFLNATDIALNLGATIVTNIVMVGALLRADLLPLERSDVECEMRQSFPESRIDLNLNALGQGFNAL